MYQHRANDKLCSTCEYWQGEREVKLNGDRRTLLVLHTGDSADCEIVRTGKKSGNVNASGCRNYKKWYKLS